MPKRFVHRHLPPPCPFSLIKTGFGIALALGAMAFAQQAGGSPLPAAPLGASAVLVLGMPASPLSQPAGVIGGHLLATIIGLLFDQFMPGGWMSMAAATATAVTLLAALRLTHPPAGADPLVVMTTHPGWGFLITPVLTGVLILVLVAMLIHRLPPRRAVYPLPAHPPAGE